MVQCWRERDGGYVIVCAAMVSSWENKGFYTLKSKQIHKPSTVGNGKFITVLPGISESNQ